jgi:hypothetical protein
MSSGKILNHTLKYPKIKMTSNIVNTKNVKSFYIIVSGYFDLDYDGLIELRKSITRTIKNNLNTELFYKQRFIDTEEIRMAGDWNYGGYEYTIFLLKENIITIPDLEVESKRLMDLIYETHFNKPQFNIK